MQNWYLRANGRVMWGKLNIVTGSLDHCSIIGHQEDSKLGDRQGKQSSHSQLMAGHFSVNIGVQIAHETKCATFITKFSVW